MTGRPSGSEAEIGRPSTKRKTGCEPPGPPPPVPPNAEHTVQKHTPYGAEMASVRIATININGMTDPTRQ